ncbi:GIY-YIG nuclease family protein [Streptomyces chartreusis]|uniref:GIY-YIG nuclease family protein n=1 Tax=Streptomyces chartreusis TaxID=1969 RepID=UPI0037B41A97
MYVIGAPESLTVKIGLTISPSRRLREIQSMSPVELKVLWSCPGGPALEQALHAHFDSNRSHGEWFTFEADPVSAVRSAIENGLGRVLKTPRQDTRKPTPPPQQLDYERVVHESLWRAYATSPFKAIDAADRLGYLLPTLLGYLDSLAQKGRVRQTTPTRQDRAHQHFVLRPHS